MAWFGKLETKSCNLEFVRLSLLNRPVLWFTKIHVDISWKRGLRLGCHRHEVMCLGHDSAALGAPAVEIWPGEDPLLHPPPLNLLPHSDKDRPACDLLRHPNPPLVHDHSHTCVSPQSITSVCHAQSAPCLLPILLLWIIYIIPVLLEICHSQHNHYTISSSNNCLA